MLEVFGFRVLTACDGRDALEVFHQNRDDIVCVILDLTMPHMDGEQAFRELRRIKPDLRVIVSSGYNEQDVAQRFVGKGLAGFIQKPYKVSELGEKMREVFEPSPLEL
jgi:two-component system, cell cycle sensor histidine kinase and response regulator CckA